MELNIATLIGVVIAALIFVSVVGTVATTTVSVAGNGSGIAGYGSGNVTNNAPVQALVTLMPLLFVAFGVVMLFRFLG